MNTIANTYQTEQDREKSILFRINVVAMVLGSFLVYPLLQKVSLEVVLYSVLCCFLGFLLLRDASMVLKERIRIKMIRFIDSIVLDDIMRSIFNVETGLLATCTAAFVANATVYALPTTATQRAQLLQSAMDLNPKEATTLLQEPGGCRLLLPASVQDWLKPSQEPESSRDSLTLGKPEELPSEEASEMTASETSQEDGTLQIANATSKPPLVVQVHSSQQPEHDSSPAEVFGSIIQSFVRHHFQRIFQSIPDGSIEGIGLAAGVALIMQLRYSKTARNVLWTAISGSATLGSTIALLGSIVVMSARSSSIHASAPSNQSLVKTASNVARALIAQLGGKWQGLLAALVLFNVGRQRSQPRGRTRHRR